MEIFVTNKKAAEMSHASFENINLEKMVYEVSSIGGVIYVHPFLFSELYKSIIEHLNKPFRIDPNGIYNGNIEIIMTDLVPENEYMIMTKLEFAKNFDVTNSALAITAPGRRISRDTGHGSSVTVGASLKDVGQGRRA